MRKQKEKKEGAEKMKTILEMNRYVRRKMVSHRLGGKRAAFTQKFEVILKITGETSSSVKEHQWTMIIKGSRRTALDGSSDAVRLAYKQVTGYNEKLYKWDPKPRFNGDKRGIHRQGIRYINTCSRHAEVRWDGDVMDELIKELNLACKDSLLTKVREEGSMNPPSRRHRPR
jgi:hypothetical protein